MEVAEEYFPCLVLKFFFTEEIWKHLKMYPDYERLIENPKSNRGFFNTVTDSEYDKKWDIRNYLSSGFPDSRIAHDEDIHATVRIQKFFHPHTLPNDLDGDLWHLVKDNKEALDSFLDYVQQFQDYTIEVKNKMYTYYRCNYSHTNSGVSTKKADCKHKITVQTLKSGKYKIMWYLRHNHLIDPIRLAMLPKQPLPTILPWPGLEIPKTPMIELALENNKYKFADRASNKKSEANFDPDVLETLKNVLFNVKRRHEFAVFKKRSTNSENSKFCDVGNSTLDPESMWYFGIIHLSDIERIQNTQIVFLGCTTILSEGLYNDNVKLYSFFTKNVITGDGISIGYLMTNTDSHEPLASFLRCFVERGIQIKRFVTDYSLEIVQAINEGYNVGMPNQSQNFNALITFSTPQIFEAFDYQIISLIKNTLTNDNYIPDNYEDYILQKNFGGFFFHSNQLSKGVTKEQVLCNQNIARNYLTRLKHKKTIEEARELLGEIENKFKQYPEFIECTKKHFLESGLYWLDCYLGRHRAMSNNYLDDFNRDLRFNHFKQGRRYSPDKIITLMVLWFSRIFNRSYPSLRPVPRERHIDDAEKDSKRLAGYIPANQIPEMVIVSPSCISVKSFNGPNFYNIYCDGRGVYYCQCPFNSFSMDYCKHIYLYKRYQKLKEEGAIIVQQPSIATNIHLNATPLVEGRSDPANSVQNSIPRPLTGDVESGASLLADDENDVVFVKERTIPESSKSEKSEIIQGIYSEKAARNIQQWEESNNSLDAEVKKSEDRLKIQREKYEKQIKYALKQMELARKEEREHQLQFAENHKIRKKRDTARIKTKEHKQTLEKIQKIEEIIRSNNCNEIDKKAKIREIKQLYNSTAPDPVTASS